MDEGLQIDVERLDDLVVVKPMGRVVRDNQANLRTSIEELVREGVLRIALDLSQSDYMDSAGLGCCSYAYKIVAEQTGRDPREGGVAAYGANDGIRKTWTMIRLDLVIPIFDSRVDALNWLRNPS